VSQWLLFRADEPSTQLGGARRRWSFDGDGAAFRLAAEARRIRLAYLFDPMLVVHLSLLEPLPHQIRAVYGEMLGVALWRFENGHPAAKVQQLKVGYKHYWELMAEEVKLDAQQHEEALKLFKREGFRAWNNSNEGAMVRSTGFTAAMKPRSSSCGCRGSWTLRRCCILTS
jgi:hypothetical protein